MPDFREWGSDPILVSAEITPQLSWRGVSLGDCRAAPTSCLHKGEGADGSTCQLELEVSLSNLFPKQIIIIKPGIIQWGRTS